MKGIARCWRGRHFDYVVTGVDYARLGALVPVLMICNSGAFVTLPDPAG
jgi:hypothetical protein